MPLLAHLLDTSAVAVALWDGWLPVAVRELLADAWVASGRPLGEPRAWFAWLAGCHDVGKADPVFQGQVGSRDEARFAGLVERLGEAGLPPVHGEATVLVPGRQSDAWRLFRHEAVTGRVMHRAGVEPWACAALAGHHGRYLPQDAGNARAYADAYDEWRDGTAWQEMQAGLADALREAIAAGGFAVACPADGAGFAFAAVVPFLTGFVVLADWLASDDSFVRDAPVRLLDHPGEYLADRARQAAELLPGWVGTPKSPRGSFPEVFDGLTADRPVQQWAVGAPDAGLTVITVPTGEGKTETALWRHAAHFDARQDGLLFALPTMATADAVFDRVRGFYRGTPAFGSLTHGRALLNAYYDRSAASPRWAGTGSPADGLEPSAWFAGRHRGLLAPVTVSTCDQVLAAAVSHKYLPVRLLGLASKHVVLDEVHAYDPYQQQLLERLLGWLAFAGGRVTLLSATLPSARLDRIVSAWQAGLAVRRPGARAGAPPGGFAYPAATVVDAGGSARVYAMGAQRAYALTVAYAQVPDEPAGRAQAVAAHACALAQAHPGARVGVIVNTVNRAVAVAEWVAEDGHPSLLLHSRMTSRQRAQAAAAVLASAGKPVPGAAGCVVVGTQVLEASLDLDFDFLVTDLAPVASLLQRAGRLWRHSVPSGDRTWVHPAGRAPHRSGSGPVLVVAVPEGIASKWSCAPYTTAEISKTWAALGHGRTTAIRIPSDVQQLVDAADVSWADLPDADRDDAAGVASHLAAGAAQARRGSDAGVDVTVMGRWDDRLWDRDGRLDRLTRGTLWSDDAQTRIRDARTITLLIIDPTGGHPFAWHGTVTDLHPGMPRDRLVTAVGCTVPVSGTAASQLEKALSTRERDWSALPILLRDTTPVLLDDLRAHGFDLDERLGLVQTRKEEQ